MFRGAGDNLEIDNSAQVEAQRKAQEAYTAQNMMSREDFLKKYGETFVADGKGGNAASEVAGQSVADYYDQFLDPNRKVSTGAYTGGGDNFNFDPSASVPNASWGNGYKYRDAMPYFDAWDNVDPHPESQDLGGVGEFWRQVRPFAAMAAMAYGANALGGMGSVGTAGGPGSAGWGMDLGTEALASAAEAGTAAELSPLAAQTITGSTMVPNVVAGTDLAGKAALSAGVAGASTGTGPALWEKALTYAKANPMKTASGVLQMLGGASGQQAAGQASPLAAYVPQGGPQPYDWQKIQNAANRAGVSMSEYVSQNQRYLNAGVYP